MQSKKKQTMSAGLSRLHAKEEAAVSDSASLAEYAKNHNRAFIIIIIIMISSAQWYLKKCAEKSNA